MRKYAVAALFASAVALSGCGGNPFLVDHNAVSSTAPGAPGYLVVGLAQSHEQPPVRNVATLEAMTVQFDDEAGKPVPAGRFKCTVIDNIPCRPLDVMDLQIMQLSPGQYRLSNFINQVDTQNKYSPYKQRRTLQAAVASNSFTIRSGEINYVGNFVVDFDL